MRVVRVGQGHSQRSHLSSVLWSPRAGKLLMQRQRIAAHWHPRASRPSAVQDVSRGTAAPRSAMRRRVSPPRRQRPTSDASPSDAGYTRVASSHPAFAQRIGLTKTGYQLRTVVLPRPCAPDTWDRVRSLATTRRVSNAVAFPPCLPTRVAMPTGMRVLTGHQGRDVLLLFRAKWGEDSPDGHSPKTSEPVKPPVGASPDMVGRSGNNPAPVDDGLLARLALHTVSSAPEWSASFVRLAFCRSERSVQVGEGTARRICPARSGRSPDVSISWGGAVHPDRVLAHSGSGRGNRAGRAPTAWAYCLLPMRVVPAGAVARSQ